MQPAGLYPAPPGSPPDVLGLELAGEVVALGPGAARFGRGDRVMASSEVADRPNWPSPTNAPLCRCPETLAPIQASAFPEAFTVAHDALFTQCGLGPGERLLMNGAAGGVGVACVQLAVLAGASAVASVRAPQLRPGFEALGANAVDPAEVPGVAPSTGSLSLSAPRTSRSTWTRSPSEGVSRSSASEAGRHGQIDLRRPMHRRGRLFGSTLRARPLEERAAAARLVERQVLPLVAGGLVRIPIEPTFAFEDVQAAYARFEAGSELGKIVLEVPADG